MVTPGKVQEVIKKRLLDLSAVKVFALDGMALPFHTQLTHKLMIETSYSHATHFLHAFGCCHRGRRYDRKLCWRMHIREECNVPGPTKGATADSAL